MPVEVIVPKVDMDMTAATIEAWKVVEGQSVKAGDLIFEIGTDKAVMEVEAPASGIIHGISGAKGEAFPVGTVVAWIYREGESPATASSSLVAKPHAAESEAATLAPVRPTTTPSAPGVRATPLARRLARLNSVDLATLSGGGPRGRIAANDVLELVDGKQAKAAALAVIASPATLTPVRADRIVPFTTRRKLTAQRLSESTRTSPHFYMTTHVDMSALMDLRARRARKEQHDGSAKLSLTVMLACLVGRLLPRHPLINASVEGEAARLHTGAHIGIAMDREGELVVPVLRDAHVRSLSELAVDFTRLKDAVFAGTITAADMRGGTFTISNLGMYGVDSFTAIINPPEAAILAVGRTIETPVGRNGQVVLVSQAALTLSSDHRIVDGAIAGRFMADLRDAIENPGACTVKLGIGCFHDRQESR